MVMSLRQQLEQELQHAITQAWQQDIRDKAAQHGLKLFASVIQQCTASLTSEGSTYHLVLHVGSSTLAEIYDFNEEMKTELKGPLSAIIQRINGVMLAPEIICRWHR